MKPTIVLKFKINATGEYETARFQLEDVEVAVAMYSSYKNDLDFSDVTYAREFSGTLNGVSA